MLFILPTTDMPIKAYNGSVDNDPRSVAEYCGHGLIAKQLYARTGSRDE